VILANQARYLVCQVVYTDTAYCKKYRVAFLLDMMVTM